MHRVCATTGLLALFASGCGGVDEGHKLAVHPAAGTVTKGGSPVPKAIVRFHPVDPATVALPEGQEGPPIVLTTETDAEGKFAMSTYLADDGVPAGEYKVTVATVAAESSDVENADAAPRPARKVDAVAKIYRDPATTTLKATVKPGENRFAFELDGAPPVR